MLFEKNFYQPVKIVFFINSLRFPCPPPSFTALSTVESTFGFRPSRLLRFKIENPHRPILIEGLYRSEKNQ